MSEMNLDGLLDTIVDDQADSRARLLSFSGFMEHLGQSFEASTGHALTLSEETKLRLRSDPESKYSALEFEFFLAASTQIHTLPDPELATTKFALHWKDAAMPFVLSSQSADMPAQFCAPLNADPRAGRVAHFAAKEGYKNMANLLAQGCRLSFDRF